MDDEQTSIQLHIAMCPWFALGHITPYLHLSNKLAQKGHKISFFIPTKTQSKLQNFNLFPNLITFIPVSVPHVPGLPSGAETTSDVPKPLIPLVMTAMDRAEPSFSHHLTNLKPDIVFYDLASWIPALARQNNIKSVHFSVVKPATIGYNLSPDHRNSTSITVEEQIEPPPGFPDQLCSFRLRPDFTALHIVESAPVRLRLHEARSYVKRRQIPFGSEVTFFERLFVSVTESDALAFGACREIDGPFADYLEARFRKPVLLAGPVLPEASSGRVLERRWEEWLSSFGVGSVVYCCMGSEWDLEMDEFEELVTGLEMSGMPFLAALRPPIGANTIEEVLATKKIEPKRGLVHGGWIQQELILAHPSVGCFVTHCGSGSLNEALVNPCQLVMIPHEGDHFFQARIIGTSLKAGIEVKRNEEDGWFGRESVSKAIRTVMRQEEGNEIGREIRANRAELHRLFRNKDFETGYIDDFSRKLQNLKLGQSVLQ